MRRAVTLLVLLATLGVCASSGAGSVATAHGSSAVEGWSIVQAVEHGAVTGYLDGVDCVTTATCVAVGNETTDGLARALVETLTGGVWTVAKLPLAKGSAAGFLFSVSCPKSGRCMAVGYSYANQSGHPLIESQSAGNWTPTLPAVAHTLGGFLYGVSCAAAGSCVAVGNTYTGLSQPGTPAVTQPLVETLKDGRWTVTPSPSLGSDGGSLNAVTCSSPDTCVAVGYQQTTKTNGRTNCRETRKRNMVTHPDRKGSPLHRHQRSDRRLLRSPQHLHSRRASPGREPNHRDRDRLDLVDAAGKRAKPKRPGLRARRRLMPKLDSLPRRRRTRQTDARKRVRGRLRKTTRRPDQTSTTNHWSQVDAPTQMPPASGLHAISCIDRACVAVGQSGNAYGNSTPPTDTARTLIIQTS